MLLEVQSLSKTYHKAQNPALFDLNLTIKKGHIHGLLGPNGAGKSTLIQIIAGLLTYDTGQILWQNTPIEDYRQLKQSIGIVPQDLALYPQLSAFENLDFFASQYRIPKAVRKARINDFLQLLGLYEKRNQQVMQFSGGMKRRVNLIAGLLHLPTLLIMDEPTVGIDVQSKQAILSFLQQLHSDGMTMLYTSHLMEEAEQLCQQVSIIDHGKILVSDEPINLIQQYEGASKLQDVFIQLTGKGLRD